MASLHETRVELPVAFKLLLDKIGETSTELMQLVESEAFREEGMTRVQVRVLLKQIAGFCDIAEDILDDERELMFVYENH
tara:strand:- start:169 stop:408 length:240 start_codon:yes stop_codon:yes gene_type:complete